MDFMGRELAQRVEVTTANRWECKILKMIFGRVVAVWQEGEDFEGDGTN